MTHPWSERGQDRKMSCPLGPLFFDVTCTRAAIVPELDSIETRSKMPRSQLILPVRRPASQSNAQSREDFMIHPDIEMDNGAEPVARAGGEVCGFVSSLGRAAGEDQIMEERLVSLVPGAQRYINLRPRRQDFVPRILNALTGR
jgi:hypothetical protein